MLPFFSLNGLESADFFEFKEWTDLNFPSHCHYAFEAVFVTDGTLIIEKEKKRYTLTKNDVFVIMPFEIHGFITETSSKFFIYQISPTLISNFESLFKNKTPVFAQHRFPESEISDIYSHLKVENISAIDINHVFFATMSTFLQDNELTLSNAPNELFKSTLLYISSHFAENISLKDIAAEFNVSYEYLSRMFNTKAKMKFNDLLNTFRVWKSISLLKDTSMQIIEICHSCGFGSIRNFNRVFLKTMSCTPKEFRNKNVVPF